MGRQDLPYPGPPCHSVSFTTASPIRCSGWGVGELVTSTASGQLCQGSPQQEATQASTHFLPPTTSRRRISKGKLEPQT